MTSLLGGIRWWAEAVVRGFGIRACDPVTSPCNKTRLCLICELFGNAAVPQAAKFAMRVWKDVQRKELFTSPLLSGSTVFLEFYFYRDPEQYEQYLLIKTLNLISLLGSIGGRTTRKPTRPDRAQNHDRGWPERHKDYGLLAIKGIGNASAHERAKYKDEFEREMQAKAQTDPNRSNSLPSLTNFWFIRKKTLFVHPTTMNGPDSINNLLGLQDTLAAGPRIETREWDDGFDDLRKGLRGYPDSSPNKRSKRVFSFGSMGDTANARTWGYVLDPKLLTMLPEVLHQVGIETTETLMGPDARDLQLVDLKDSPSAPARRA
jgi:CRISPR type III-B/RAMP module RAMP protein Cmr1